MTFLVNEIVAQLSLDSGCEGDCIRFDECKRLGIPICPLDATDMHVPTQADGKSPLNVLGKVKFQAYRDKITLNFDGYVTDTLQSPILCGAPFLARNKIVQELHNRRIIINGKHYIEESSHFCPNPVPDGKVSNVSISGVSLIPDGPNKTNLHIGSSHGQQEYLVSPNYESSISADEVSFNETPLDNTDLIEVGSTVPKKIKEALTKIHKFHHKVFNGDLKEGYNSYSGNFDVDFNFLNDIPPPIHYGCVPSYNKPEDNVLLQLMVDRLEEQNVVAKANALGVIPRYASPCMLVKKNSVRQLKEGDYEKLPDQEKLKYNRFVLCQNKLNNYVQKIPAKYNKLDETINIVGAHEFVITSDLTDSFWQRHISQEKLPYFAFHSPFKGTYIFLRSTQGFLNQSEGLEELLTCVLHEGIMEGWCRVHADNLYVMGHSMEKTVDRWQMVLDKMLKNNLKLSPKKTYCFPDRLDLLGWIKEGKYLKPDAHRRSCLENAPRPNTVKDMRSFLGSYRTFYRCQKDIAFILGNLEKMTADKPSSQKLVWTPSLIDEFEKAKFAVRNLDTIYLPKIDDQLVITSDYSKLGISATLWSIVDSKFMVVARMSTKLDKAQENLLPCEGEALAIYVAGKNPQFKTHILASRLRTIALLDSKPVVQAANLLKQGKFSSSRLINFVLTSISDLNLTFQHMSGKMGQNFADDHGSRNPIECDDKEKCKICTFVKDGAKLMVHPISFSALDQIIIGQIDQNRDNTNLVRDIIQGTQTIPFANKAAMKFLQDKDQTLNRVKQLLLAGEAPHPNEKKLVKRYMQKNTNVTLDDSGCLMVKKMNNKFIQRSLIVIPREFSFGLLQGLHIHLNHPTSHQLRLAVDTRFFILDRDKIIKDIFENCPLCQSVSKIPMEIQNFLPNQMSDHPGLSFTVDIVRAGRKYILISVENFSGFVTSLLLPSEKADHLLNGLIQAISPFKASSSCWVTVRTDKAPGFQALKSRSKELNELGFKLDLGEPKNKNSTAIADKKIQEIENEIKKISSSPNYIDAKILARATSVVNEKIRNQGLSAKEILFARDQNTFENIPLRDDTLQEETMDKRNRNNVASAKSKATVNREAIPANACKGQVVFLKQEGSKWTKRDMYLVLATDHSSQTAQICKIVNSFGPDKAKVNPHLHSYTVKQTDIYLAPNQPVEIFPDIVTAFELDSQHYSNYPDSHFYVEDAEIGHDISMPKDAPEVTYPNIWVFEEDIDEDSTYQCDNSTAEVLQASVELEVNNSEMEPLDSTLEDQADEHLDDTRNIQQEGIGNNFLDKQFNPYVLPKPGEEIIYWDPNLEKIVTSFVIPMDRSKQRKWPGWVNVEEKITKRQFAVNLDTFSDNCVGWRYANQEDDATVSRSRLSSVELAHEYAVNPINLNISVQPQIEVPLNLDIPPDNLVEAGRVYRFEDIGNGKQRHK